MGEGAYSPEIKTEGKKHRALLNGFDCSACRRLNGTLSHCSQPCIPNPHAHKLGVCKVVLFLDWGHSTSAAGA